MLLNLSLLSLLSLPKLLDFKFYTLNKKNNVYMLLNLFLLFLLSVLDIRENGLHSTFLPSFYLKDGAYCENFEKAF